VLVAESGRPILPWALNPLIDGVDLSGIFIFEHLPGLPKQARLRRISEVDSQGGIPMLTPKDQRRRSRGSRSRRGEVTEVSLYKSVSAIRCSGHAHSVRLPLDLAFTPPKWRFNDICPATNWDVRFRIQFIPVGSPRWTPHVTLNKDST